MLDEVTLKTMLHDLLSAYPAHGEGRLQIAGDDVTLDDRGATPVALVFHELATNAAKYGALSVAEGQVAIDIANDGTAVTIRWSESNGPKVVGPPDRQGFGTRLTDMSVVQQLGGTLERAWLADGLRVDIQVKLERLVRT
jgi:two-component sensor histidine kinase